MSRPSSRRRAALALAALVAGLAGVALEPPRPLASVALVVVVGALVVLAATLPALLVGAGARGR